ncbi:hypothetical protein F7Q99_23280 [Streptomyces kaniharaensis]|uniref:Uncharacterized protein n=1 Tax=Streptomyces kaniharaensis TaxID=212423 RepID=A0A6N7KXN7_9ACTN|nr:hypothetical protein [Streptomyces kaniharaensis]MQS15107.1 hypothetical protein [Streptomyces kaniharaensis]
MTESTTDEIEPNEAETSEAPAVCTLPAGDDAEAALVHDPALTGPRADCVLCGEPTELPADHPGSTLCPVCAWQQAQRIACSG